LVGSACIYNAANYLDAGIPPDCKSAPYGPAVPSIGGDRASSLRIFGNAWIRVCRDPGMNGICENFYADDPNLSDNAIGNDTISFWQVFLTP